jgi:hypothetical protein
MIAIIVSHCGECCFVDDTAKPWLCDAEGFVDTSAPRPLPGIIAGTPLPPPPDWCPLREADRLVTLRRPR